jgi:uncharacterized damage-inducible protein DinB
VSSPSIALADLLTYTDWEREQWLVWLRQQKDSVLQTSLGSHAGGRFADVGDTIRHIFSAEKRYVDRLSNRPITDTSSIPTQDLEALLEFGRQSRADLKSFIEAFPEAEWDSPIGMQIMNWSISASARKIVTHVLIHEIRHWAQIATTLRLSGLKPDFHDFLFSPALGGEVSGG